MEEVIEIEYDLLETFNSTSNNRLYPGFFLLVQHPLVGFACICIKSFLFVRL